MSNILNIAKKEFSDLLFSKFMIIVVLSYLIIFVINLYPVYRYYLANGLVSGYGSGYGFVENNLLASIEGGLWVNLVQYGTVIALIIGYLSIFNERKGNALNTLLVKPLYRDTIINGKLLGSIAFLLSVLTFISILYTLGIILIVGSAINPVFYDYLLNVPFVIILSTLCGLIFYAFSMLASIMIKSQTLSLFASSLIWVLIKGVIPGSGFADYIGLLGSTLASQASIIDTINKIDPYFIIDPIFNATDGTNLSLLISSNSRSVIALLIYLLIIIVLDYIIFIRKDIA